MKIFSFNSYITRQSADPVQFVMKKIDKQADHNNQYSEKDDVFTCFTVHIVKLQANN